MDGKPVDARPADNAREAPDPGGSLPGATLESVRRFSHDIVSPLMSVLALSEVLLLEARADERLNDDIKRIHAAAEEALALVRALGAQLGSRRPEL